jgi:hypothetical protein
VGVRPNLLGGGLAALEIARTDQDGEVLRDQLLCDLEADPRLAPVTRATGFTCMAISFVRWWCPTIPEI